MNLRDWKIKSLIIVFFLLTACAQTTKTYSGPELPASQTALIESGSYTRIVALDGRIVRDQTLTVLPGRHTIQIGIIETQQPMFNQYWFYSRADGLVDFVAEAGHRYLIDIDFVASPLPVAEERGSGFRWVGSVTDRTTNRVVANTGYLPVQVEPRIPPTLRAEP